MTNKHSIKETISLIKSDFSGYFGTEWSLSRIMLYSIKTFFKGYGWVVLLRFSQ